MLRNFQKQARWTKLSVLSLSERIPYSCHMEIQLSSPCLLQEACTLVFKVSEHILGRAASDLTKTPWQVWIDFTASPVHTHATHHFRDLCSLKRFSSILWHQISETLFPPPLRLSLVSWTSTGPSSLYDLMILLQVIPWDYQSQWNIMVMYVDFGAK